ncbi:MAG: prepilin-type N-terminal cleavage/methylation domain-containing protein [Verrucomicrobia bacterium]|nr:prepilin-type N-terminal cleavage/methylation domain-containing protein [Verrucomicrobiota bacterium]
MEHLNHIRKGRRAFTILEMLIVIAIIGIIVAIGLPAFTGMSRGSKVKSAVSNLQTTMSLARQWAITHHERTYLVIADDGITYTDDIEAEQKAFRSYSIYTVSEKFIGDWRYLPEGVIFDSVFEPSAQKNLWSGTPQTITIDGRNYICVIFKPDGSTIPTSNKEIFMAEGWVTSTGGTITPTVKPDTAMLFSIDIFPLTGLTRIREYFDYI